MGTSNPPVKRLKNVRWSAISKHLLCNCTINFDGFDILAADSNIFELLLRGSYLIECEKLKQDHIIVSVKVLWLKWQFYVINTWLSGIFQYIVMILMSILAELGFVFIWQVKKTYFRKYSFRQEWKLSKK